MWYFSTYFWCFVLAFHAEKPKIQMKLATSRSRCNDFGCNIRSSQVLYALKQKDVKVRMTHTALIMADDRVSPDTELVPKRGHPVVHALLHIDYCMKLAGTYKQRLLKRIFMPKTTDVSLIKLPDAILNYATTGWPRLHVLVTSQIRMHSCDRSNYLAHLLRKMRHGLYLTRHTLSYPRMHRKHYYFQYFPKWEEEMQIWKILLIHRTLVNAHSCTQVFTRWVRSGNTGKYLALSHLYGLVPYASPQDKYFPVRPSH